MNTNKATKQNTTPFVDDLFNQMANISKASAYDIQLPVLVKYKEALERIISIAGNPSHDKSEDIAEILSIAENALKPQL